MKMSVSKMLDTKMPHVKDIDAYEEALEDLKHEMAQLQQVAWMTGKRAVIVFEGFDAAGKGTCIRHLTELLDPRSCRVVPIGAPTAQEAGQHYLQRFWKHLPSKGEIVVFDRSWYGRVLVEKVEKLAPPNRLKGAYQEINQFERMLADDGIVLLKIFLVVSKKEQLKRFKDRLEDPFKRWKITSEDVRNRKKWNAYVLCADEMIRRCPEWTVIASDDKKHARVTAVAAAVRQLRPWMDDFNPRARKLKLSAIKRELRDLGAL